MTSSNKRNRVSGKTKRLPRRPSRRVSISLNSLLGNDNNNNNNNDNSEVVTQDEEKKVEVNNNKKRRMDKKKSNKSNTRRSTIRLDTLKESIASKKNNAVVNKEPEDVVKTVQNVDEDLFDETLYVNNKANNNNNNNSNNNNKSPEQNLPPALSPNTMEPSNAASNAKQNNIATIEEKNEQITFTNPLLQLQSSDNTKKSPSPVNTSSLPRRVQTILENQVVVGIDDNNNIMDSYNDADVKYENYSDDEEQTSPSIVKKPSKMKMFKQQPSMILQHHVRTPIKEEPSKFKVIVVNETSELPSNTPRNQIDNRNTKEKSTSHFYMQTNTSADEILLSKMELEMEMDNLKKKLQLLDAKIEQAGISNKNPSISNNNTKNNIRPPVKEEEEKNMIENKEEKEKAINASNNDNISQQSSVNNMLDLNMIRPLRPGGNIKKNGNEHFINKYKTNKYFQKNNSATKSRNRNNRNNTRNDRMLTSSRVINKQILLRNDNDNQEMSVTKSVNDIVTKNQTPVSSAKILIQKYNEQYTPSNPKTPSSNSNLTNNKTLGFSSPLIISAMKDSENFITKLEKKMSVESKLLLANSVLNPTPKSNKKSGDTNIVNIRDDLDDQVQRILRNRRNRYNNKEIRDNDHNNNNSGDNNNTNINLNSSFNNTTAISPARRIHIKRSGSVIIESSNNDDNNTKNNSRGNMNLQGSVTNYNAITQSKYEWAHLDVYSGGRKVSQSPTNISSSNGSVFNITDNNYGNNMDVKLSKSNLSYNKSIDLQNNDGIFAYQMRRSLPVLGLPDAMQVNTAHELIDPILKGGELMCLTKNAKNDESRYVSSSWIAAECTFWLAPNLCELQWYENSSGNGGLIPLENVTSVEKISPNSPNYKLMHSNRVIDSSKVFILSVVSPDDVTLALHLAAPTETIRDEWWGGLLYCRSVASFAAVKRKYKN